MPKAGRPRPANFAWQPVPLLETSLSSNSFERIRRRSVHG